MQISEAMTRDVGIAGPDDTVRAAAKLMAELGVGALPVGEDGRLVGMVTDRDIAVRAVAGGLDPDRTTLREVMNPEALYCFEDETAEEVARRLGGGARRLPVLSRDERLVGVVSLGDLPIAGERAVAAPRRAAKAAADERQGALAFAGGKPHAEMPRTGEREEGSGVEPDDLMKGGF